jgi:hypothetical protein
MRLCLFLGCIILHVSLKAQDSLSVSMLVPDHAIKVSPLHLINFYPTFELSYEKSILPDVTLQAELGYVLDLGTEYKNQEFQNKRGVKMKLETRYYFWGRTDKRKLYYIAGEVYGNIINFDRGQSRVECYDLECNFEYRREYLYKMRYRENGFTVKAGLMKYLFRNFFFDINSGLTLRNIKYHRPAEFEFQFEDDWSFFNIPNENNRVVLSPNLGLRLGYRLK